MADGGLWFSTSRNLVSCLLIYFLSDGISVLMCPVQQTTPLWVGRQTDRQTERHCHRKEKGI